jgi:thiol reductant ABC exporter CydC subunit
MEYRSGDLLARIMADIETLEQFYVRVIVPPLAAALVSLFTFLILGSFDPTLGIVILIYLLTTGLVLPLISRWLSQKPATQAIDLRAKLDAALVDEIQGLPDLAAFGQTTRYHEQILALNDDLGDNQESLAMVRGLSNGLTAFFTGLAGLTILWLAIPLVTEGKIDGLFLALLPLTAIAAFEAITPLSLSLQHLEFSNAAGRRLFDLIDAPAPVCEPDSPSPYPSDFSLEVSDLSFSYDLDEPLAIEDLSFTISSGSRATLLGASGSGKTTLVDLLLRFWEYQDGFIRIGSYSLRSYRSDYMRQMIGVVPQHPYLFNSTIRDNLLLAKQDATDEELAAACEMAQIDEFISSLPQGFSTMVGENGLMLSGGERQRLAIARVFLKDAPILILDEATSHLDATTAEKVMQALDQFMANRTTLVISHQMESAQFDQVIRLESSQFST